MTKMKSTSKANVNNKEQNRNLCDPFGILVTFTGRGRERFF